MAKVIPGLRPWEVLSIEQAMDQITYDGKWYREPLGSRHTGPPYIKHWNKDVKVYHIIAYYSNFPSILVFYDVDLLVMTCDTNFNFLLSFFSY